LAHRAKLGASTAREGVVVSPGHEIDSIEHVVRRQAHYGVVRKFHPEPIKIALELDPRRAGTPEA
jgi:hypothetical protein